MQQVEIEPMRPVVQLTDFGSEVMKGTSELETELPVPASLLRKLRGEEPSAQVVAPKEAVEKLAGK